MADSIEGVIETWSNVDSIGRIKLDTGEYIRFGGTACAFVPKVGVRVRTSQLENHPLGGRRAHSVSLIDPEDADRILDETRPLRGTVDDDAWNDAFRDEVAAQGLLGILLREPITSRAHLRAWFARAGVEVRFDDPRAPLVRVGDGEYKALLCRADLPDGKGFLSFASLSPFPLHRERELALMSEETGGHRVDRLPGLAPLVEIAARCAASEVAVVAHQSLSHFMPAAAWASANPIAQWTAAVRHQDGFILLTGMRALYLPDLIGAPEVEPVIFEAAAALVKLGRRPEVGELLGPCLVVSTAYDWVRVELFR